MNISIIKGWWLVRRGQLKQRLAIISGNTRPMLNAQQGAISGRAHIEDIIFKQGLVRILTARYSVSVDIYSVMKILKPNFLVAEFNKCFKDINELSISRKDLPLVAYKQS